MTVFERDDRPGGLLMYGIPNMKLEKSVVERRVALMRELGIVFELGADVSDPKVAAKLDDFDAVVVAAGARAPRGLSAANIDAPGRGVCRGLPDGFDCLGARWRRARGERARPRHSLRSSAWRRSNTPRAYRGSKAPARRWSGRCL